MSRYTEAKCRLCRREGQKLFLKATRCNTEKCAIAKRESLPGQHGMNRQKLSNYGLQLREKQKVKRMYGVLERQFRRYFAIASKTKGVTGKVLLQLLERRLDNVIFRLGLGSSRNQARQMVRHNFVYINGRRVNIPSFLISSGDAIAFKPSDRHQKRIREIMEFTRDRTVPAWQFDEELKLRLSVYQKKKIYNINPVWLIVGCIQNNKQPFYFVASLTDNGNSDRRGENKDGNKWKIFSYQGSNVTKVLIPTFTESSPQPPLKEAMGLLWEMHYAECYFHQ